MGSEIIQNKALMIHNVFMKKNKIILSIFFLLSEISVTAQKLPLDMSIIDKWPSLGIPPYLSNDGKYVMYSVDHLLQTTHMLIIQSTLRNWEVELPDATYPAEFTQDSGIAVFTKHKDSLGIVTLGSSFIEYIPNVLPFSFRLPKKGTGEWLAYQLNNPVRELIIRNLRTGKQYSFASVADYIFSDDGNVLLVQTKSVKDSIAALQWVNLSNDSSTTFWKGRKAVSFSFDNSGLQLSFSVEDKINNQSENSLWYYKAGKDNALQLADNHSTGIDSGLKIDRVSSFSKDGNKVYFYLKEKDVLKPKPDAAKVDIWSYFDAKLQSNQLNELAPKSYIATIDIGNHRITRLVQEDERILPSFPSFDERTDNLALIESRKGSSETWNNTSKVSVYLISTNDGERKQKKEKTVEFLSGATLSPEGRFVVYYDPVQKNYFAYDVSSGVVRNITKGIPVSWTRYDDIAIRSSYIPVGVAGWVEEDKAILIYDQYDIWLVDPSGNKSSVNLTNGFGRNHNIEFRLGLKEYSTKTFTPNEKLILKVFNKRTKDSGFYIKTLNERENPELLTIGAYAYDYIGISALKATSGETYIVRRMSATESPNYFVTTDFQTFIPLSNIHPEKDYNWLRTELMSWKSFDGTRSQGILYKPENFDPKKKYPVILNFYEKLSDRLNEYFEPQATGANINIPYFVSNDYLVFTPDIHYSIGEPGQSAYNSVVSAAKYLAKYPWVNATKMGIQGQSFGGYETNYLVTHTNLFAAAVSSSGFSDLISEYGAVSINGFPFQDLAEIGQRYIGATLWRKPDLYIKNSPIFRADKLTTPLLMMNNKMDGAVNFSQGVELFTCLRRLGKKAWMLQYDEEGHVLITDKAKKDYTTRMTQFFDHYLKGAPAPKWMLSGIPATVKGIDDGLKLVKEKDRSGNWITPGPGLLVEKENKPVSKKMINKPYPSSIRPAIKPQELKIENLRVG